MAVHSMVDFLEATIGGHGPGLEGRRVCLMGTAFTVGRPRYGRILTGAGAASVESLAATRTERTIAHLQHRSPEGRRVIRDEIAERVREADVVALACTCFPLVGDLIRELNPEIELLDPAVGVDRLALQGGGSGPNRLTVGLTGDVLTPESVRANASRIFPGWELEAVLRL
jgi:glutamate racemase